uniref:hypothetical protein n=1 Tax=Yersinia frederiksenii TaxID=29484 RepID=UPI001F4C0E61|nr:hypothetical protein [Yersinia frederiksenii]ULG19930.1 hypothetical protein 49p1_00230 [Yersinia frederiksenii]
MKRLIVIVCCLIISPFSFSNDLPEYDDTIFDFNRKGDDPNNSFFFKTPSGGPIYPKSCDEFYDLSKKNLKLVFNLQTPNSSPVFSTLGLCLVEHWVDIKTQDISDNLLNRLSSKKLVEKLPAGVSIAISREACQKRQEAKNINKSLLEVWPDLKIVSYNKESIEFTDSGDAYFKIFFLGSASSKDGKEKIYIITTRYQVGYPGTYNIAFTFLLKEGISGKYDIVHEFPSSWSPSCDDDD